MISEAVPEHGPVGTKLTVASHCWPLHAELLLLSLLGLQSRWLHMDSSEDQQFRSSQFWG